MSLFSLFSRSASLKALSALDDSRLSDLGLDRHDVAAARRMGNGAAAYLAERRSQRAASGQR